MTTIDFYTHCADRLEVAAKLVAKAWAQHGSVRVLTADAATTDALDRFLWQVPRDRVPAALPAATARWPPRRRSSSTTRWSTPARPPCSINLHPSPPPFFSRFERLAEIVGADEDDAAAGRERWRSTQTRGYELRPHNLAERA